MRWISLILVGLLFAGVVACQWEPPRRLPVTHRERWVRTVDGWELASSLTPPPPRYLPPLHPLVIASGQLLLVIGAFVIFPPRKEWAAGVEPPASPQGAKHQASNSKRQTRSKQQISKSVV